MERPSTGWSMSATSNTVEMCEVPASVRDVAGPSLVGGRNETLARLATPAAAQYDGFCLAENNRLRPWLRAANMLRAGLDCADFH